MMGAGLAESNFLDEFPGTGVPSLRRGQFTGMICKETLCASRPRSTGLDNLPIMDGAGGAEGFLRLE